MPTTGQKMMTSYSSGIDSRSYALIASSTRYIRSIRP